MVSLKNKLSSYLTYNEMGTTVLRIIMYDQNVRNPENTEFFSPSFKKRKVLNWPPIWFSQIEFPIARIIPKHTRNPKIWNKNRSLVKVNLNPTLVISMQSNYTSKSKKFSFPKQVTQSSSYLPSITWVKFLYAENSVKYLTWIFPLSSSTDSLR